MTKVISRPALSPEDRAEMQQVARVLLKARWQISSADNKEPRSFQITIGGKANSIGQPIETKSVEIEISPEILEHITRVIAEAGAEGVVISRPTHDELTTQQAAELLGVSRPYLIKLIDVGKIPCRRVGHFRRIRRDDLERYKRAAPARREAGLNELAAYTQEIGLEY